MAFFDEMKNRVTQASQSAAKSAKEFSEITRLNGEISDAESRINQLYNQIGYEVYCAYSAHPLPEAADLIEQVNALHDKIENCRMQIQTINAASRCPNCGAKIRPGMAFCSGCGARLVQAEPAQPAAQAFCQNCGAPLAPGAAFCTSCGTRVEQPAAPTPAPAPRHPRSSSPPSPCSSRSSSLPSRQPRRLRSAPAAVSPSRRMRPSASTAAQSWTEPTTYKEHTPHHGRMEWIDRNL